MSIGIVVDVAVFVVLGFAVTPGAEPDPPKASHLGRERLQALLDRRERALEERDWKTFFSTLSSSEQDEEIVNALFAIGLLNDARLQKIAEKYVDARNLDSMPAGKPDPKSGLEQGRKAVASCVSDKAAFFAEASDRLSDFGVLPELRMPVERTRQTPAAKATRADVVVRKVDLEVPKDRVEAGRFLWGRFVNRREERQFASVEANDWKATFKEYQEALVPKAKTQSLDEKSLGRCLAEVLGKAKGENCAFLPVGAYWGKQGGEPVWIIVVRWGEEYAVKPGADPQPFGHVRVYAFDPKSLDVVGFMTCD